MQKNLLFSLLAAGASMLSMTVHAAVINIDQALTVPLAFSDSVLESHFNVNPAAATFQAGDTVVLNYSFGANVTGHVANPALVLAEAWDSGFAGQLSTSGASIDFIGANNASVLHTATGGGSNTRLAGQFDSLTAGTYAFNSIRVQFDVAGLSTATYAPQYGYFALVGDNVSFTAVPVTPVPEPETYALMLIGLGALRWRAMRKAAAAKLG
jgi:hypothetical protein